MNNVNILWEPIARKLTADTTIPASSYEAWLAKMEPVCVYNDSIVLCVRNNSIKNRVVERFMPNIVNASRLVACPYGNFIVITPEEKADYLALAGEEVSTNDDIEITRPFPTIKPASQATAYTFDNFIVGSCNQFAAAAARAVIKSPGNAYNPLLIYGGVGLGKTHILTAIAAEIALRYENKRVMYTTSERFMNDFLEASQQGPASDNFKRFKQKYNVLDALVIDDIQFLSKKTSTQEALFHIFNDLHSKGSQIVLSSDRPVKDIKDVEQRLISRFNWGISAEITMPDFDTRCSILRTKAASHQYNINDDVIEYIAEKCVYNIRELEGMLQTVVFFLQLNGYNHNQLQLAKEALKDFSSSSEEKITMDSIIEQVSKYYSIPVSNIVGKRKTKDLVEARQVAMYLIIVLLPLIPLTTIGQKFSGRDHTTVIYARNKIAEMQEDVESPVGKAIVDIRSSLLNN